jgi:hypothetical protein
MAKPHVHAQSSARIYGGSVEDYLEVHSLADWSKSAHASVRHRVVFHHREGAELLTRMVGPTVGPGIGTEKVVEQHVTEDIRAYPGVDEYLAALDPTVLPWYGAGVVAAQTHAVLDSVKRGGDPKYYVPVHQFVDSFVDAEHPDRRIMLHHAFGCFVAERVFGPILTVPGSRWTVYTRDVVESHVFRELGMVPDLTDWVRAMKLKPWMSGRPTQRAASTDIKERIRS